MLGGRVYVVCTAMRWPGFSCPNGCDFAPLVGSIGLSAIVFFPSFQYVPLNAKGASSISPFLALRSSPPPPLVRPDMADVISQVNSSVSFLLVVG